ncbi:poly(glycerol-phosphate) alpha-glucosyltransferase [Arthrobacter ginsengisoli]|uniref:Poly(Glycerol-phosphate) alpha-glucosyltransferase n=1 Tax=Arthrobacter ginsengisoli TaxID=1356565 RepID=A0ABU1UFJ3_9MICC|nr:glycosyltransferase [Arthrobacter ginsengisoli]MDR7083953.1 poly(glycerol-phosphate) alpha-glucosyltransferase [Arthrobacter ginsengisoli]
MDFMDILRAGMGIASERRSSILASPDDPVTYLTLDYQRNHKDKVNELYKAGRITTDVRVLNFHDFYFEQGVDSRDEADINECMLDEPGIFSYPAARDGYQAFRCFDRDGDYLKYKCFDLDGNLIFVDYRTASQRRSHKVEFSSDGRRLRELRYDLLSGRLVVEKFFDRGGSCYMTSMVDESGRRTLTTLHGRSSESFSSRDDAHLFWLDSQLGAQRDSVVFLDYLGLLPIFRRLAQGPAKVLVLHSSHTEDPYSENPRVRAVYQEIFENRAEFDAIVFLTDEQRRDVERIYGQGANFFVIPHAVNSADQSVEEHAPFSRSAITLARLSPEKNLKDAISAFKIVVHRFPDAIYEIFGYGPQREELLGYIREVGLESNVFIRDFSSNPASEFRRHSVSILTSNYEAFALVVAESLECGTPVISYRTKYGPETLIRDGVDGFLVPFGDREMLADRLILLFGNESLFNDLSFHAKEVVQRFGVSNFRTAWNGLLAKVGQKNSDLDWSGLR